MRLYLGPFVWAERISSKTGLPSPAGVFGWRMPPGAVQAIDFRGPQGGEAIGALSPEQAIFVCPDNIILPAPWVQIASDPAETLTAANRTRMRSAFQHGRTIAARRFTDVLHELMTTHAELDRSRCAPPRIASRDGKIKWLLGGQVVGAYDVGIGSPEWAGVVARHQQVYREIRRTDGSRRMHSKYLATLLEKYRISEGQGVDAFVPLDLPRESPVEPSTTHTETFPGTSATLGGDHTWTELSGSWGNESGQAEFTWTDGGTHYARCESALSTDDMRVEVVMVSATHVSYRGVVGRFSSSAATGYTNISCPEINDYYGQRLTAGSSTDIITSELSGSITLPSTDAIVIDGDQIEIFQGANSRGSTTDTNITGNLRGGLGAYVETGSTLFDTWVANDIETGVSISLTGSSSTSEAGTLTTSHSKSLSGQASTSQAGTLTPAVTLSLTGVSVEAQAGNVSYSTLTDISLTLSGQSAAAQAGTITSSRTITLTGASSTAQTGTVTPTWQAQYSWDDITGEDGYRVKWGTSSGVYTSSADVAANVTSYLVTGLAWGTVYYARVYPLLGGVEQDPSVERVLTQNDVTVSLSGITVTASNGTIATASSKSLSGQEVLVGSGLIKSSFIKSLSGTSLETQTGNLIYASEGDLSLTLSGIEVSISSGNITSYIDLSLTGIEATSSAGTITASTQSNVEVTLSGQAVSAFAGTLVPSLEIPGGGQSGGSGGIIPGIRIKGRIFQWRVY